MGSSSNEREGGAKSIDASVGGLVWVRRRNGSWWPGRIMGLDELSESCLVSPRSGTPVKLLGREDASVDWYNLEKSKRVKPFRCGEYDECIEKAKASAANPNKKTVKYARREDAIIHALELENARLGKGPLDFCTRTNNSGGEPSNSARESHSISCDSQGDEDVHSKDSDSEDNSNTALEFPQPSELVKEPSNGGASKVQSMDVKRRRTPNDSEDDGSGGTKRMRGLQDLGVGIVSRTSENGGSLDLAQQDSPASCELNAGRLTSNGSPVNSSKSCPSLKKKRSQMAHSHELLKRKNRRRPLTQVLESTSMVSVPITCDNLASSSGLSLQGLADNRPSELESNGSKSDFSTTKDAEVTRVPGLDENDSSAKLFDVPFVGEEKEPSGFHPVLISCSSGPQGDAPVGQSSQSCQAEAAVSLRTEGIEEGFGNPAAANVNDISQQIEKGSSKWQSKGKRNSRHVSKDRKKSSRKYGDLDDESDAYLPGLELPDEFSLGIDQKVAYGGMGGSFLTHNGGTMKAKPEPVTEDRLDGCWDWSKRISRRDSHMRGSTAEVKPLADCSLTPQRSLPYRHSRFTVPSRYRTEDTPGRSLCSGSSLYDIEVEVNSTYRPRHVPLVSLMSKLNGKAIIGHPLTVDILEDGVSDTLVQADNKDMTLTDPPRGSNLGFAVKPLSEIGRTPGRNSRTERRTSCSKSSKSKKIGLQAKKIRKLSSLTGHRSAVGRKPLVEKLVKGGVVACVPVKITFSRIAEGVQGSARPGQHLPVSGDP